MGSKHYSLQELSELVGIEPRSIRWYISEGLMRGPESLGRGAYYTDHHLKRLRTIKQLRETYGMPVSEIRRYTTMAGDEDIEVVPVSNWGWSAPETFRAGHEEDPDMSSVDVRRGWRGQGPAVRKPTVENQELPGMEPDVVSRAQSSRSPIAVLLHSLRQLLGERRVPRSAKAETVTEIEINPEIALRIRGYYRPAELALFEQLADHLRELLLGGGSPTQRR